MKFRNESLGMWLLGVVFGVVTLCSFGARSESLKLDVQLSSPVMLAGSQGRTFIKIGLTGAALREDRARTGVNVAIVLDRSGSMSGEKLWRAKEAAKMAIGRLGPDDIVSVVVYDDRVDVVVPATKVTDRAELYRRIDALRPGGNTALFAGVSKGAKEVRKFLERNRANRVILLSDGLANVGPSSPGSLADLGSSLVKDGISVTTIGLGTGYNEDLMERLARASDGNHGFARTGDDLASIFSHEFGDLLSVIARDVVVEIRCLDGVRPIRVLGRDAEIYGQTVMTRLNQIYANQEKYFLIEVSVPKSANGYLREIASVDVVYADTAIRSKGSSRAIAQTTFSDSNARVEASRNKEVMVASAELLANETNRRAVDLRDQGRTVEARQVLESNAVFLEDQSKKYRSKRLKSMSEANRSDGSNLEGAKWKVRRKTMRKRQHSVDVQQQW